METDAFTYTLRDSDGDIDTAILRIDTTGVGGNITIGDVTVNEGGTANIVVTLSEAAPAGGLTLNYTFSGGTATIGDDYTAAAVGATVTILAGATTANIVVNAKTDGKFDDNETYNVVLSGVPAGWTISDGTGVVTIDDTTAIAAPIPPSKSNPSGFPSSLSGSEFTEFADDVDGEDGEDGFEGEGGGDTIDGLGGDDTIDGEAGDDTINGGSGEDHLIGDTGLDTLHGDAGDDLIFGGDNADHLFGDADHDEISGGSGTDDLHGGAGNDYLRANDRLQCGYIVR